MKLKFFGNFAQKYENKNMKKNQMKFKCVN